jgi:hypothetical protein
MSKSLLNIINTIHSNYLARIQAFLNIKIIHNTISKVTNYIRKKKKIMIDDPIILQVKWVEYTAFQKKNYGFHLLCISLCASIIADRWESTAKKKKKREKYRLAP